MEAARRMNFNTFSMKNMLKDYLKQKSYKMKLKLVIFEKELDELREKSLEELIRQHDQL